MTLINNDTTINYTANSTWRSNISSLMTLTTGNITAQWNLLPVASLVVFVVSLLGNMMLLLIFVKDSSLRTPFNVYIINLLIANLACILVQYPMDIITNLFNAWLLGNTACTLYLYANSVFGMVRLTIMQFFPEKEIGRKEF